MLQVEPYGAEEAFTTQADPDLIPHTHRIRRQTPEKNIEDFKTLVKSVLKENPSNYNQLNISKATIDLIADDLDAFVDQLIKTNPLEDMTPIMAYLKTLANLEKTEKIDGKFAFYLYESFGFPWELTEEIAESKGQKIDKKEFEDKKKDLT